MTNLLESGLGDPVSAVLARRMRWGSRLDRSSASPAKLLWETATLGRGWLGRCKQLVRVASSQLESQLRATGKSKRNVLFEWSKQQILASASVKAPVIRYILAYYDQTSLQALKESRGDKTALRAISLLRTDSFWFWPRKAHVIQVTSRVGCCACGGGDPEDAVHLLLECPRWAAPRELLLEGLPPAKSGVKQLLGGEGSGPEWKDGVLPKLLEFLVQILPERERCERSYTIPKEAV